jgi:hypothetical protein
MTDKNELNLTENLNNIEKFISELKEEFGQRSLVCIKTLDSIIETLSDQHQLELLISSPEFKQATLDVIFILQNLCKNNDPNFINKMEIISQLVHMSKIGITLAQQENAKIV